MRGEGDWRGNGGGAGTSGVARDRSPHGAGSPWRLPRSPRTDVTAAGTPATIAPGLVHEWFLDIDIGDSAAGLTARSVFVHLAWMACGSASDVRRVLWIGRACWPDPAALIRPVVTTSDDRAPPPMDPGSPWRSNASEDVAACDDVSGGGATLDDGLARRSVFIDPPDAASRCWAIDLAARSPAVRMVIADGAGLTMSETRRLQLAARAGGAFLLLARRPSELGELSAAATRWRITPRPPTNDDSESHASRRSDRRAPHWTIELLRCKGVRPAGNSGWNSVTRAWHVQWNDTTRTFTLPPALGGGAQPATTTTTEEHLRRPPVRSLGVNRRSTADNRSAAG